MDDKAQTDAANLQAAGQTPDPAAKAAAPDPAKEAAKEPASKEPAAKEPDPAAKAPEPAKTRTIEDVARDAGVNLDKRADAPKDEKIGTEDPAQLEPFGRDRSADGVRDGSSVVDGTSTDAKLRQIEQVGRDQEKLNRDNREGHELNMEAIEREGERAQDARQDGPPTGKEDNRNTPRIDKTGRKVW